MRTRARLLTAIAAFGLVLAPMVADARPGGGSSSGSRGSRSSAAPPATNTAPGGATRFDRTEAPRTPSVTTPAAGAPAAAPRPTYSPAPAGNRFGTGLMAGLAGGLLGAGLFGLLSGSGFMGGIAGLAGMFGFLLQIALIAGLVYLVVRLVRGARRPAVAGGPALAGAGAGGYARTMTEEPPMRGYGGGSAPSGAPASRPVNVGASDFAEFERTLVEVNAAWTRRDMPALNRLSTPEMVRYFTSDMRDLDARGWRNETRDLKLEAGDLSEAWNENGLDYATVAMRFSLVDVTTDATGKVVEGDAGARQTTTEYWTFVRPTGGAWMLSAIQQTG